MAAQISGTALNPQNLISYDLNTSTNFASITVPLYQQISSGSYTLYIEPNSDIYMNTRDRGNLITSYFSFSTATQAFVGTSAYTYGPLQNKNDFNYFPLITRMSPFTSSAFAIAWNGSIWVAVGQGTSTIASSVDGISWVPRDLNIVITSAAYGVAWNGSIWIVVGTSGNSVRTNVVATSPDGIVWTGRGNFVLSGGVNTQLGRIAWNGSVFLAGAYNGGATLYTSPDGITWTERSHSLGYTYKIVWNGSTFLICIGPTGNTYELLNDAVNGSVLTTSLSLYQNGAAWSPTLGIWVICGFDPFSSTFPIYYSYNGVSWTSVSLGNYTLYDVQWNGTNFVAAGATYIVYSTTGTSFTTFTHSLGTFYSLAWAPTLNSGSGRWVGIVNGSIYYTNTNNGSSGWTLAANAIFADNNLNTVAWSPQLSQFVAVGTAGTNTIAYSYDGITWVGLGATFLTFTTQGAGIVWAPQLGIWCATGYGTNSFLTSPNGINWTPRGTTGVDDTGRAIAWSPQQNQFVMGGTGRHTLATSSGGTLWVGRTGITIFSTQVNGVVWAAQLNTWIAVGSGTNTLASSQDGISWTPRVPVSLAALTSTGNCVAWNGSLFVAGGSGTNQIATSINGVNWTGRSQAAITGTVIGITWSPGLSLWIATGSTTNTIATSPDGITWTGRGTIFTTQGNAVAWSPQQNQLVACGSGTNTLATSVNGIIWSGMTSPGTIVNNLYSVIWNGQQWLCSGDGNSRLATSPDGLTWTTRTSIQTTTVWGVAWNDSVQLGTTNGGLYVSVGSGTSVFASSLDGITWTNRGSTGISSVGYGICWFAAAGIWVAVGNGTNCIATGTADASTVWQGYTGTSIFSTTGWAVAAGPNLVVAVGEGTSAIASSPDGITWTQRSAANVIFARGRGVAYSPTLNIWVAVGSRGNHPIAYSRDGLTWIGVTGNTIFSTTGLGVSWNGSFFIAVGQGTNLEATSWDGINWRAGSPPAQGIPLLHCVGTRPAIMVAGGIGTNTLASSWDGGLTWAPRGIAIFTTGCYCVAWNGLIWVAGGQGTNNFATSTDGVNWTGRGTAIITTAVYGVVWAHSLSLWVAVGSGTNTIATSFNGVNWTARNPVTNGLFATGFANAIAWNGSLFVATGVGSYNIAISRDGITWSYATSISPANSTSAPQSAGIAWNGNVWVLGTSGAAVIYSSPDGMNWATRFNTPGGNGISSITWNGSLFLATPYRRTDGQYFTSPDGINWTTYTALIDGTINPFATQGIYSAAWNPYTKIWLLCGYDSTASSNGNMIISNPDATNAAGWTCRNSLANSVVVNGLYGISWDPGFNRWIGIPFINSSAATGFMVTSPYTGTSWTHRTLVFNATTFINGNAVAYSSTNTCHVAVGSHSVATSSSIIWYSTDGGINWTSVSPTGVTTAIGILRCLVWAPTLNLWVIGGTSGVTTSANSIIYTSSDIYARSGWTLRNTGVFGGNVSGSGMYGVAWNGSNLFVGVGGAGNVNTFATSTDGITWTGRGVTGLSSLAHSVCWAPYLNLWIAVGVASTTAAVYGSANGQTWTNPNTAITGTLFAVATNNKIIVAVGQNSTSSIWYSYNAITWYSVPNANTLFFSIGRAVAWNGSLWVATGTNINFTATSTDGVNWTAGRVFTTNANVIGFQNREKTFTISNTQWTGRTSQQTFRILG